MTLTGNTVQSTYLDLVQLEQSGAGLPSHAGKEAALYDGAGNQILGRSAMHSWMDPYAPASSFAETFEFSTFGDANQATLEAAGWSFVNCTAEVSDGIMWLSKSGAGFQYWFAELTVNFTGDFDFVTTCVPRKDYIASGGSYTTLYYGGAGVADTVTDVAHWGNIYRSGTLPRVDRRINGKYTTLGGTAANNPVYSGLPVVRCYRRSGSVEITGACVGGGILNAWFLEDDSTPENSGWASLAPVSDATTFNKMIFPFYYTSRSTADVFGIASVRRLS